MVGPQAKGSRTGSAGLPSGASAHSPTMWKSPSAQPGCYPKARCSLLKSFNQFDPFRTTRAKSPHIQNSPLWLKYPSSE